MGGYVWAGVGGVGGGWQSQLGKRRRRKRQKRQGQHGRGCRGARRRRGQMPPPLLPLLGPGGQSCQHPRCVSGHLSEAIPACLFSAVRTVRAPDMLAAPHPPTHLPLPPSLLSPLHPPTRRRRAGRSACSSSCARRRCSSTLRPRRRRPLTGRRRGGGTGQPTPRSR